MRPSDLDAVAAVAAAVHPEHFERREVFAERLALDAEGCRVFVAAGTVAGYVLSHPWRAQSPPALDSLLGSLPAEATTYYIHDIALLPAARGQGAASHVVALLKARTAAFKLPTLSLVAVDDAAAFWRAKGFIETAAPGAEAALKTYGPGAQFMTRRICMTGAA